MNLFVAALVLLLEFALLFTFLLARWSPLLPLHSAREPLPSSPTDSKEDTTIVRRNDEECQNVFGTRGWSDREAGSSTDGECRPRRDKILHSPSQRSPSVARLVVRRLSPTAAETQWQLLSVVAILTSGILDRILYGTPH